MTQVKPSMPREEIVQKAKELFEDTAGPFQIELCEETTLEDLEVDSLDRVQLVLNMENEFQVVIPDDEAEKITTFGQAVDALHEKLN